MFFFLFLTEFWVSVRTAESSGEVQAEVNALSVQTLNLWLQL